jgi:hypothetical protein
MNFNGRRLLQGHNERKEAYKKRRKENILEEFLFF